MVRPPSNAADKTKCRTLLTHPVIAGDFRLLLCCSSQKHLCSCHNHRGIASHSMASDVCAYIYIYIHDIYIYICTPALFLRTPPHHLGILTYLRRRSWLTDSVRRLLQFHMMTPATPTRSRSCELRHGQIPWEAALACDTKVATSQRSCSFAAVGSC